MRRYIEISVNIYFLQVGRWLQRTLELEKCRILPRKYGPVWYMSNNCKKNWQLSAEILWHSRNKRFYLQTVVRFRPISTHLRQRYTPRISSWSILNHFKAYSGKGTAQEPGTFAFIPVTPIKQAAQAMGRGGVKIQDIRKCMGICNDCDKSQDLPWNS